MAVVINEFELLPAAPAAPPPQDAGRAQEPPREPAPAAMSQALRALDVQALRAWAP
jgi:hypothetical protein